jgi:hypothetical protein
LAKIDRTHALVFASTHFGGYRIVMPVDFAKLTRELNRHQILRSMSKDDSPVDESLYDHWLHKWGRNSRNRKTFLGCKILDYFLEVVDIYTPTMRPYVMSCGETTSWPTAEHAPTEFVNEVVV